MWWWDYTHLKEPFAYGTDETYRRAAKFLGGAAVEDWGCGTGYARRFFRGGYVGIDLAQGGFADIQMDIRERIAPYYSQVLLRHVLEHNLEWERILHNVRFARRIAVVVFTPFGDETRVINWTRNERGEVPDISFKKEDLTKHFPDYTEQEFETGIAYGKETLFCVEMMR